MASRVINPVLAGFYPDPSICEAEGTFYLVCSSFSYFPGLPIFRSKNGFKWEQIGNIIDRPEQLDFEGAGVSRGLFAPTIRYNNGKFYCICTQVDKLGNFFVTAENPEGPWSNPIPIAGAEGIDPSLFFDDDGSSWYVGTRPAPEGPKYNGNWEIWIQKIDLESGKLLGQSKGIWRGALRDCVWPEGPHIYKINGTYYLIHAEGGTGMDHAICVARCQTIDGEWEGKKSNPILTHRHLGKSAGVRNVGHGDLVSTGAGKWWMCCLASRPYGEGENRFSNMGRETFFVPVKWEDGWPVCSWETGLIENAYSLAGHVVERANEDADSIIFPAIDDFNSPKLADYWLSLRARDENFINCTENSGYLRIYGGESLNANGKVHMVVRRQTAFSFEAATVIFANYAHENDACGIVLFQNEGFHFRLQMISRGKLVVLQLIKVEEGKEELLAEDVLTGGNSKPYCVIRVVAEKQNLFFEYGPDERNMHMLKKEVDASILSQEKAGGFVGTVVGVFAASGNGQESKDFYADFDWFKYENIGRDWICK
ncbi:MAG: glycoside hydrolase family 43 protein [Treponema sp.]|nr:glycoside hydrolase family 43 protein [Treponema sp.]